MTPTREEMIQKIKDRIEYHADEKKYGYFLGKGVIDSFAEDVIKDLQISELTARAEAAEGAEKKLKEAVADIEELLAQEDYLGVCWACANNNDCKSGNECVPKWRGMREDKR